MKTTLRRLKDLYEISSADARYLVKTICRENGMYPEDGEIELDSCYVSDIPSDQHLTPTKWVRVKISAKVRGEWYQFGIELAQSIYFNNTMCANMEWK